MVAHHGVAARSLRRRVAPDTRTRAAALRRRRVRRRVVRRLL